MEPSMIEAHLKKLRARDDVSAEEERAIRSAVAEIKTFDSDKTVVRADVELDSSMFLLEGFMCRYKDLRDGSRQITELHVAGDYADLHSFTLKRLDHNVMTLTPCRVAIVPHEALKRITEEHPHLTRVYWFATNMDAAIHREWALSLGRRSAISRLAHVFCELQVRLSIVELATDDGYALPLTQTDLAECLGLTPVHINRTLKELREQELVEFRGGQVRIYDRPGLQQVAEFNPNYLYLEKRPR
jgi:CRP-like cAMP-binding protein